MTGSSAANWSRAAAGSPRPPGLAGEVAAGGHGVAVLGAEHPLAGIGDLLLKNARRRVVPGSSRCAPGNWPPA
jgi:hypothetical protein